MLAIAIRTHLTVKRLNREVTARVELWFPPRALQCNPIPDSMADLDSMTVICKNTVMKTEEPTSLSLEELSSQVEQWLAKYALLGAQQDNRVSQVPDARTIRYYTTLGLLDRPRIDGRTARYTKRHLLQLLAIKALQAADLPLSEIQSRLYGRSNSELEATLASLSEHWQASRKQEAIQPVVWREVLIEPGVKLLVQDGWIPQNNKDATAAKIQLILDLLAGERPHGGKSDEQR